MNGTVTDFDLDRRERRTGTGPGDTLAAVYVEAGAMVGTYEFAVIREQELIRRPVQRAALVRAAIEKCAYTAVGPEDRHETVCAIEADAEFPATPGRDFVFLAQVFQIDSPGKWPHVDSNALQTGFIVPLYISPPPRNPLTAALAAVFGAIVLAGAFFIGFFVLLVVVGVGLVVWIGLAIRFKWAERKLRGNDGGPATGQHAQRSESRTRGAAIEGEYTVVSRDRED